MTRNEILDMARKAGFKVVGDTSSKLARIVPEFIGQNMNAEVERLVRIAQHAAYERAAAVCDHRKEVLHNHMPAEHIPSGVAETAFFFTKGACKSAARCATAILALKEQE